MTAVASSPPGPAALDALGGWLCGPIPADAPAVGLIAGHAELFASGFCLGLTGLGLFLACAGRRPRHVVPLLGVCLVLAIAWAWTILALDAWRAGHGAPRLSALWLGVAPVLLAGFWSAVALASLCAGPLAAALVGSMARLGAALERIARRRRAPRRIPEGPSCR